MVSETNPAWIALTTQHRHLGTGGALARRYYADVVPIAAVREWTNDAMDALAVLLEPDESLYLVEPGPLDPRSPLLETRRIRCHQMFLESHATSHPERRHATHALDSVIDAAEMLALTDVAFPGLFRIRTPQMGRYRGIRVDGQLVAMTGERLVFGGFREVSAVCTHPQHTGHGYAAQLVQEIAAGILHDGDTPMLHVSIANSRAVELYRRLGFKGYTLVDWVQVARRS